MRWGEKRLFVSHHHPLPQITGLFFLLDRVVLTSLPYNSYNLAQASGTMKGKLLNYEFKIACEQELIYLAIWGKLQELHTKGDASVRSIVFAANFACHDNVITFKKGYF